MEHCRLDWARRCDVVTTLILAQGALYHLKTSVVNWGGAPWWIRGPRGGLGGFRDKIWQKMLHFLKTKKTPQLSTYLDEAITNIDVSHSNYLFPQRYRTKREWTNCCARTICEVNKSVWVDLTAKSRFTSDGEGFLALTGVSSSTLVTHSPSRK